MPAPAKAPAVPRLTYLRIKNYRALRDVEFHDLTPLSVFIGPNGSGKSTVLDALAFLAEALEGNLGKAWNDRDRFKGMRTRGNEESISFEIQVGPFSKGEFLNYLLELIEAEDKVISVNERLTAIDENNEEFPLFFSEEIDGKRFIILLHPETLGLNAEILPNERRLINNREYIIARNLTYHLLPSLRFTAGVVRPFAIDIISFLTSYRYVQLTDDHLKGYSDAGPRERLSANGDNLPNVLYYLHLKHPAVLEKITAQMRRWVPALADIVTEITSDERLLLRFKDAPFEKPLPAQYMSDGTMRLAALLTLLYEPEATGLLGIEEPENELHPQLLAHLAEDLITASETRQLFIATHSPALLNALEPEQVWILHRGTDGYTQATRTADLPGIPAMVAEGSPLGYLWARNFFDVGNPLDLPAPVK